MATYYRTKNLLKNFFVNANTSALSTDYLKTYASYLFYQHNDLIIRDDIEFYVVCYKTFGNGDIMNGIKTYKILTKYFKNVHLVGKTMHDFFEIFKLHMSAMPILYLENGAHLFQSNNLKIFIVCALPLFNERFEGVKGPKKTIFIDEYNGGRITTASLMKINGDIDHDVSSHQKMSCSKCLDNESESQFIIDNKKPLFQDYGVSAGLGNVRGLPTLGVHIEGISTTPTCLVDELLEHIVSLNGSKNYYFAYFSIFNKINREPLMSLVRFCDAMRFIHDYHHKDAYTTFIMIDPQKYLYINNEIFFKENDTVTFFKNFCIVENKQQRLRMYYLTRVSHNDMMALIKLSEPYVLLTGDQSMVEGISLQMSGSTKIIFYQLHPWKRDFIEKYMSITKNLLSPDASLVKFQNKIYNESTNEDLHEFYQMLIDECHTLRKQSALVYKYIIDQQNIEQRLISIILYVIYNNRINQKRTEKMVSLFLADKDFKTEYYEFINYINNQSSNNKKRKASDDPTYCNKCIA